MNDQYMSTHLKQYSQRRKARSYRYEFDSSKVDDLTALHEYISYVSDERSSMNEYSSRTDESLRHISRVRWEKHAALDS